MTKTLQRLLACGALLLLAACGGGGGDSGSPSFGPGAGGSSSGSSGGTTPGASTSTQGLTLSISSTTITPTAPATVTLTLRDGSNAPLANRVVTVSTARPGLATLSAPSVLTGSDGTAQVVLRVGTSGTAGADEVTAVATLSTGVTRTAAIGFTVAGSAATIATQAAATTLRVSTGAVGISATVLDERGQPLANQIVRFSADATALTLSARSALTDSQGRASTSVRAADASLSAAAVVSASTTVNGRDVESGVNLQLVAEQPAMTLTLSNSNISAAQPTTVNAFVRDVNGQPVAGTVVSFGSQFGLASFDPATAVTGSNGVATTVATPRTATTTGADVLSAQATLNGATARNQAVVQLIGSASAGAPVLRLDLSATSISAASPATVTATLNDSRGSPVQGQVVTFAVVRNLARTNIGTALTDAAGRAVVVLSPTAATSAGADEITATASYTGASLQATRGFQVQATAVTLDSFVSAESSRLSPYGQTTMTLTVGGASVTSPVNITVSSACVALGKATLSPSTFTATTTRVDLQYRDNGCGAVQRSDQLQAVVTATGTSIALTQPIDPPAGFSIAFVQSSPEQIFLRGSGYTESSLVTFEARDAAGNPLPEQDIELRLQTGAGGVLVEGRGVESVNPPSPNPVVLRTNALGRVSARVNSGTSPTPVRVHARLRLQPTISTVSSNLSVAVGLPSQLNFSMSQGTMNIEGMNIDGTTNTYQIIAADRNGNPVPVGTSINFVTEGGQIEPIRRIEAANGLSRTTANFITSEPRPKDGRITILAYALGEESFIDLNGNNVYDPGEPFQDLGNVFKDRVYDAFFDARDEEFVPLEINNSGVCAPPNSELMRLEHDISSAANTCDGRWSGAGQVYVRRAVETVLSTSRARPLWADTSGLANSCVKIRLQDGPLPQQTNLYTLVAGDTWYGGNVDGGVIRLIAADDNQGRPRVPFVNRLEDYEQFPRLNPMAAGTTISVGSLRPGLSAQVAGGSPVPDTLFASSVEIGYTFTDPAVRDGEITITFRSPSGVGTTYSVRIVRGSLRPTTCP